MKTPVIVLFLCVAVVGADATLRADDVLPQPAPAKRYEKLASHSPFAPPSVAAPLVPVAAPPPGPTWSDNLTVTSLMESHGVYTATVVEKDSSNRSLVRSDVENRDNHLTVASVHWADRPDDIKVTLRKGTQFGDVHFDPSATGAGASPGGNLAAPNRAGAANPPAFRQPPSAPMLPPAGGPGAVMHSRPVIRANPQPAPVQPQRPLTNAQPIRKPPALPGHAGKDDDDDDDDD